MTAIDYLPVVNPAASLTSRAPDTAMLAIVGRGRVGNRFARVLQDYGHHVVGPVPHDVDARALEHMPMVLLCVPDRAIADVSAGIPEGPLLGHCSGASGLAVLGPRRGFSVHPLLCITQDPEQGLLGGYAAVMGTDATAIAQAEALARALGMTPFTVDDEHRVAYHAAASATSNFVMPLLQIAQELLTSSGIPPGVLQPLMHQAIENWSRLGAVRALTGPITRGDEATVDAHRDAVASRCPEWLPLFDTAVAATKLLAAGGSR